MEDPVPALEQRLRECREGEAQAALLVNLSYLDGGLPHDFVPLVLRANPHVTELDLSRCVAVTVTDLLASVVSSPAEGRLVAVQQPAELPT